ncbi:MAG TPA: BsuPI-related putative proteinase inhibitor [Mycobacteriales bacterium]|nr:BsuPI-related putative proteinase inhibitor [Mycobacteriales bacterium]
MSERDLLPRKPFAVLPPEPGGFEAALARGRQRRRRTAGSSVLASVIVVALAVALNAPNPNGAARLEFTEQTETNITRDVDRPAIDDDTAPEAIELDAPAQRAQPLTGAADLAPSSRDAAPAGATAQPAPARTAPTPTSTRRRRPAPPVTERTLAGAYPACVASGDEPTDRWCLAARHYDSSATENGSRVGIDICLTVETSRGRLTFPTEQQVDFEIRDVDGTEVIWRWSHLVDFDKQQTTDDVAAGECRTYEVAWGDVDNAGYLVNRGRYVLTATALAKELGSVNQATLEITVT